MMWEMMKSHPWMFAVGGLVLLGAIIGVVIGIVTKGRWKDRQWMIRDGNPLMWDKKDLPIGLMVHNDVYAAIHDILFAVRAKFESAVKNLNLFVLAPDPISLDWTTFAPVGHITIVESDDCGGHCEHRYEKATGRILSAKISIPTGLDEVTLTKVILHEFGHALGLDHDEQKGSIMNPQIQNRPQALSSSDIEILRGQYGVG